MEESLEDKRRRVRMVAIVAPNSGYGFWALDEDGAVWFHNRDWSKLDMPLRDEDAEADE